MTETSYPKEKINVLLLENIHPAAVGIFHSERFKVEVVAGSLGPDDLAHRVKSAHILGIRSKTQLTAEVLNNARRLLAVGAFCIGTNQIDLRAAASLGLPVFNAPFSNTRSVAELVISHIIALLRRIPEKSQAAHKGMWLKSAEGSFEARGKTVGIVGYGHIGSQVSVMAEALGMNVIYFDIVAKLGLGNAKSISDLDQLLASSDLVTLHVPATPATEYMIDKRAISKMKNGSYLINYSRGNVVDIDALAGGLSDGRIAGAAIDVFPEEPKAKGEAFSSRLQGLDNVILTPHIGGSTLEAQENIGTEVAEKLVKFMNNGSTTFAVNVPQVELPVQEGSHRILHFHKNEPGVLQRINSLFGEKKINVLAQYLMTDPEVGYLVMDVSKEVDVDILGDLKKIPETIRARILY